MTTNNTDVAMTDEQHEAVGFALTLIAQSGDSRSAKYAEILRGLITKNLDDARDAEAWRTRCKLAVWSTKTDVEITSDLLALFDAVDVAETVEDYAAAERAVQAALTVIAAQAGERK